MAISTGTALLVGAGAGLLSSGASMLQSSNLNTKNRAYATKMFKRQNAEYDRRLTDQRAYDDPASQRARLEAAGLNPSLMYGETGAVTSQTPPSPSAPSAMTNVPADFSPIANFGADFAGTMLTMARAKSEAKNYDLLNAKEALTISQSLRERANAAKSDVERSILLRNADSIDRKYLGDALNTEADYANKQAQNDILKAQLPILAEDLKLKQGSVSLQELEKTAKEIGIKQARFNLEKLSPLQARELLSKVVANYASAGKDDADSAMVNFDRKLAEAGINPKTSDAYTAFLRLMTARGKKGLSEPSSSSHPAGISRAANAKSYNHPDYINMSDD